jgi:proton-dependent oligopeptide transporter, POT family
LSASFFKQNLDAREFSFDKNHKEMSENLAETKAAPAVKDDRFPSQIKFIVGNEACERFSYYGLTAILEVYLGKEMGLGEHHATEVLHLFGTAVYFLPLLGGYIADRWLGRYWTILIISLFYCAGHATLAAFGTTLPGIYMGLGLIAFGAGGIKPCVSTFVGDQFRPDQHHLLTKIYGWFYWAINLGAAAAFFLIPPIHKNYGYKWAFGVPGIAMGVATLVFWLGRKRYVRQPPARLQNRLRIFQVMWYALTHQSERTAGQKYLDVALKSFSREEVEGTRSVLGIILVFCTVPMFWACFNQSNSTWVNQGEKMTPWHFLDGETMQGSGAVLVMIWVPILTLWIYPLLERRGIKATPLRRMGVGMVLGGIAFFMSGLVQAQMDHGATLSINWQLVPYVVLEAGEVLVSATALEFAFEQAPKQLKSLMMGIWLMTTAGGHFLIAAITYLNDQYVQAKGAPEFYFYAVLMLISAGLFMLCAHFHKARRWDADAMAN